MAYDDNNEGYATDNKINPGWPLDYDKLRSLGIELTQQLSGERWTDYNLHDPGITILEYLCYALTDLAYRTSFDLEDILTAPSGNIDRDKNFFFTRREILSTNPVSINDFRKLIIDSVPEIHNAWVEPVMSQNPMRYCKGLYKVIILLNDQKEKEIFENEALKNEVLDKVKICVNRCRNIGEDLEDFIILKPADIKINATVAIGPQEHAEEILAEIYAVLKKTLTPAVNFYTESQLKEKGYSLEAISNGPLLQNGFIADEELTPRPKLVDPSDLVKAIAGARGVVLVQELFIEAYGKKYVHELCPIDNDNFPFFKYDNDNISIVLVNDNFKVRIKPALFLNRLKLKFYNEARVNKPAGEPKIDGVFSTDEQFKIKGVYRNLDKYVSIQHLFPEIYKLKTDPDESLIFNDENRITEIAKVKQLKAFLMLFEQVIANYLAQLANIDNVLSAGIGEDNFHTYFTKPLSGIPGANKIIDGYNYAGKKDVWDWDEFEKNAAGSYGEMLYHTSETAALFIRRKNRIFDHIFSRFNFILHQYPFQLYSELYSLNKIKGRITPELLWKKDLLKNLIPVLRNRAQAFDYTQENTMKKMGGFQEKIYRLLYIGVEPIPVWRIRRGSASIPTYSGASKTGSFFIKRLSPVFSTVTMSQNKPTPAGTTLAFKNTGISFFKDGLAIKNYTIVCDDDDEKIILLKYKSPAKGHWQSVGRFNSISDAMKARTDFIAQLRKINIESEGFHLVEHILLRPHQQFSQFGFKILDKDKHVLCTHHDWTSFENRDRNIAELLSCSHENTDLLQEDFDSKFEGLCKIAIDHSEAPDKVVNPSILRHEHKDKSEPLKKIYQRLLDNLDSILHDRANAHASIKTQIKRVNGAEMPEDFFTFRITIVLPAWPARFQDIPFREFVQKLLIENCPAHIRLHFKWLDIRQMQDFEKIYFAWMSATSKAKYSLEMLKLGDKMIELLYDARDYK